MEKVKPSYKDTQRKHLNRRYYPGVTREVGEKKIEVLSLPGDKRYIKDPVTGALLRADRFTNVAKVVKEQAKDIIAKEGVPHPDPKELANPTPEILERNLVTV